MEGGFLHISFGPGQSEVSIRLSECIQCTVADSAAAANASQQSWSSSAADFSAPLRTSKNNNGSVHGGVDDLVSKPPKCSSDAAASNGDTAGKQRKYTDLECAAIEYATTIQVERSRKSSSVTKKGTCLTTVHRDYPKPPSSEAWEVPIMGLGRCVPIDLPSDMNNVDEMEERAIVVPKHVFLVNFPENHYLHIVRRNELSVNPIVATRNCVMCGMTAPFGSTKSLPRKNCQVIPSQNKGLCNHCDVQAWLFVDYDLKLEIKWCKGCKNFRPWSFWGELRQKSKCKPCRDHGKATYAAKKERAHQST